jgi:hypothetical protein
MFKTFFDPTIKGNGYAAGTTGYMEYMGDITKVLTAFGTIQAAIAANPIAPAWPASSTVPAALKGIPVRSAVLLVGLLAGVPVQSNTYDASSGPAGALETSFGLAISPALAVLENGAQAAILAVIANYDMEVRTGGVVFDNSATDYSARLGEDADIYAAALTGKTATAGMLAYLSKYNPAAPRVTGSADSIAKLKSMYQLQGKIEVPTITLAATADHITPPGAAQYLINQYNKSVSNMTSSAGKLVNIWNKPDDSYTEFSSAGSPVTPTVTTNGTGHCNYTTSQILAVAKLAANAAKTGKAPSAATVKAAIKNEPNLFVDPSYKPALLKYNQ